MRKRDKIHHFFIGGQNFREEFRRQIRLLITITLGFTIAFTWRQTIFDASQALVQKLLHTQTAVSSSILTSLFLTLISLILIYLTAQIIKIRPDN